MVVIKISTPDWPLNLNTQTPKGEGIFGDYQFEINNNCKECDLWIIWGGLQSEETVLVNKSQTIYVTDEAHEKRKFHSKFLEQFQNIAAVRKDLNHNNIIPIHEFAPWYFGQNYEEITQLKILKKTKTISIVASDLTWLQGHKDRFAFVNKLIGHFKDKIDVFGRGFNPIGDKFEALAPYKYSIAIENNRLPDYFTEKLSECYLTYTMPIYYGCPNIHTYYSEKSLCLIDIKDHLNAFRTIEEIIDLDPYMEKLASIEESRSLYLNKYHFFPAIIEMVERNFPKNLSKRKQVTIKPEVFFTTQSDQKEVLGSMRRTVLLKEIFARTFF